MRMDSVVIISDYLLSVAKEHQALERGVIRSWNEISKDTIHEDVIIIDTKLNLEEDKSGNSTVVGKSTFDLLEFLRVRLPNLLNQGKTILALCNPVEQIFATPNRTWGSNNYRWLLHFGPIHPSGPFDYEDEFIHNAPDPLDIHVSNQEKGFNSYFLNVPQTRVVINPENSRIVDYDTISSFSGDSEEHDLLMLPAISVESWETEEGELIEPDGRLVLLPRPDNLRVDIEEWFRSLLQIGSHYSPNELEVDQFNRMLKRSTSPGLDRVYTVCNRFPAVSRQLTDRYADRNTLLIEDEYDVQDLLHCLLQIFFADIRAEEWAPSYGGSSPRIDFLLKNETIAIEVKITRDGRGNKQIKQELSEDKEHYRSHPDCNNLVCYVYDPGYEIENPAGFENDLSEQTERLNTEVIISSTARYGSV